MLSSSSMQCMIARFTGRWKADFSALVPLLDPLRLLLISMDTLL